MEFIKFVNSCLTLKCWQIPFSYQITNTLQLPNHSYDAYYFGCTTICYLYNLQGCHNY